MAIEEFETILEHTFFDDKEEDDQFIDLLNSQLNFNYKHGQVKFANLEVIEDVKEYDFITEYLTFIKEKKDEYEKPFKDRGMMVEYTDLHLPNYRDFATKYMLEANLQIQPNTKVTPVYQESFKTGYKVPTISYHRNSLFYNLALIYLSPHTNNEPLEKLTITKTQAKDNALLKERVTSYLKRLIPIRTLSIDKVEIRLGFKPAVKITPKANSLLFTDEVFYITLYKPMHFTSSEYAGFFDMDPPFFYNKEGDGFVPEDFELEKYFTLDHFEEFKESLTDKEIEDQDSEGYLVEE